MPWMRATPPFVFRFALPRFVFYFFLLLASPEGAVV